MSNTTEYSKRSVVAPICIILVSAIVVSILLIVFVDGKREAWAETVETNYAVTIPCTTSEHLLKSQEALADHLQQSHGRIAKHIEGLYGEDGMPVSPIGSHISYSRNALICHIQCSKDHFDNIIGWPQGSCQRQTECVCEHACDADSEIINQNSNADSEESVESSEADVPATESAR